MSKRLAAIILALFLSFQFVNAQDMAEDAKKLYNEGNSKREAGDFNGAIQSYDKALAISKDYRIYYNKGISQKKLNLHQESIVTLTDCIKLKPDFDLGYNARGGSYFSLNMFDEALADFEKVISVSTNAKMKSAAKSAISRTYTKQAQDALANGDAAKAVRLANKAVEQEKYDAAYLLLARANYDLADYDKSIAAAQAALDNRKSISAGGPNYYIGVSYKQKGDLTKAREFLQKAATDPTYAATANYELSLIK